MEEKDSEISGPCEEFRIWFCGKVPLGSVAWYCIDVSETTESSTKKLNPFSVSNHFPSVYYAFLNGCFYSLGGQGSDKTLLNDVWILDIKSLDSFAARGEEKLKEPEKPQEGLLACEEAQMAAKPYGPDSIPYCKPQEPDKLRLLGSRINEMRLPAAQQKEMRRLADQERLKETCLLAQESDKERPLLAQDPEKKRLLLPPKSFSKNPEKSQEPKPEKFAIDRVIDMRDAAAVKNSAAMKNAMEANAAAKAEAKAVEAAEKAEAKAVAKEAEKAVEAEEAAKAEAEAAAAKAESRERAMEAARAARAEAAMVEAAAFDRPRDSLYFEPESPKEPESSKELGLRWIRGPPMTFARCNPHTMVVDQKLYVLGGFEPNQSQADGWIEGFDPVVGKWESLPSPPDQIHSSVMISGLLKAKKEIIIAKQLWDRHPMSFYSYNIITRCWNTSHETKASVHLPPNAGRAVTVGNTLYWISTEEHNHECIIRAYDLDRNMWFKDHLNTATIFGRREHFSSIYSSRPGFLHLRDQKFCLLLQSSITKDDPESSIEYLYCVILDISPIYEHEDRGMFELTTVSVQKYSMDRYIKFLDCMLGDRVSGVKSVDRRGQSTSANISFQEGDQPSH